MLKMKALNTTVPISCQVAVHQAQPETASRVGLDSARGWHLWSRKFLFNFQILNANERPARTLAFDPNVMVDILRDSNDHPGGSPVWVVDSPKLSVCIYSQRIIYANPQSSSVIFEQRCNQAPPSLNRSD